MIIVTGCGVCWFKCCVVNMYYVKFSCDAFCNMLFFADEPDTDLETDRLLGQQRTDDQGFFDDKVVSIRHVFPLRSRIGVC